MPSIHEQLSEQFGALHRRLKGWQVFPEPVTPEPPFQPFTGYTLAPVVDDGRVPTVGSSLLAGLSRWLGGKTTAPPELPVQEKEPEPTPLVRTDLIELQTSLPANLNLPREAFEAFLAQLAACGEPLSFELVGQPEQIHAQFVLSPSDAPLVRRGTKKAGGILIYNHKRKLLIASRKHRQDKCIVHCANGWCISRAPLINLPDCLQTEEGRIAHAGQEVGRLFVSRACKAVYCCFECYLSMVE